MSDSIHAASDIGVSTVLDPAELRRHLEFFSSPPWRWGKLSDIGVRVLRSHSGNRCTMEIALSTATGVRRLIGKVYASDGRDIFQAMDRISQAGFGPEAEFSIPQPLAYLPELHLLVQEKVEGHPAEEDMLIGREGAVTPAVERCARWLAQFHRAAPRAGPVLSLNDYQTSLARWLQRIAELGEPLAGRARRIFYRLELAASALAPVEMCAGHGDYKPPHVILAPGRTATCDWDRFDVADPCRDVARFVVALHRLAWRHFGSMRALDSAAGSFLRTYISTGCEGIEPNLPFHKAAICVQFAKYDISQPIALWREEMGALLEECLCILEEDT